MIYRVVLIAATCLALAACSGSEENQASKASTDQASTPVIDTPVPASASTPVLASEGAPANAAATNSPPTDPATCPYSVEELNQGLGLKLSIVNAVQVPFAGGTQLSCQYTGEPPATITVNKLVMQDPKMLEGMEQFLAGSLEAVPNDPDKAQWNMTDSGLNDLTLHYVRAGTSIDVRLLGVDQTEWPAMKQKLLDLRRLP
ncbi:hypothetical protein [uncultured Thiothrix sp.]|jgi:hypothetical protein|uniref:hypothetical protein n=1 Tax=uncultured Thiothrix sp. TaxID=223185 RepID=UPI00261FE24F|nr:hypothetical protein [uncultured Thiothrix sp.]HMT92102.1 hypothetical protein [Thiolinea sp.]